MRSVQGDDSSDHVRVVAVQVLDLLIAATVTLLPRQVHDDLGLSEGQGGGELVAQNLKPGGASLLLSLGELAVLRGALAERLGSGPGSLAARLACGGEAARLESGAHGSSCGLWLSQHPQV